MSKITYETLRHDLDKILEMAQPIIEHAKLIDELHKRICFWEQDMRHWYLNEPELINPYPFTISHDETLIKHGYS